MAKKKRESKVYRRFHATCPHCRLMVEAEELEAMDDACERCGAILIINDRKRLLSRTKKEFEECLDERK